MLEGCGWKPYFVEGDEPMKVHRALADTLDTVTEEILAIRKHARETRRHDPSDLPMIVLPHPEGRGTGPKTWTASRSRQLPRASGAADDGQPGAPAMLEQWLRSYHPEELFDENGKLIPALKALAPIGEHRIGANPHANGGLLMHQLRLPDFRDYGLNVPAPGSVEGQDMIELGAYVRDVIKLNMDSRNFRVFGPDETMSNRLSHIFEVTDREWNAERLDTDEFLSASGRRDGRHAVRAHVRGLA